MISQQDWLDKARMRQARKRRVEGWGGGFWSIPYSNCNPYGHLRANERKTELEKASRSKATKTKPAKSTENTASSQRVAFLYSGSSKRKRWNLWPWEIQYFRVLRPRRRSLYFWSSALNMKNHPDNPRNIFSFSCSHHYEEEEWQKALSGCGSGHIKSKMVPTTCGNSTHTETD